MEWSSSSSFSLRCQRHFTNVIFINGSPHISYWWEQGCNARKLIAVAYTLSTHIETSSLWAEFVNKNRCISVRLVSEEVKSIKFCYFDNSHNSFIWPECFIDFFIWKMDPMSGFDIRLVFTLPPRDSTLQYTVSGR